jgi:ribose transport system ATP-binding protein
VGRDASLFYNRERTPIGDTLLKVDGLSGNGVSNISFELKRGEVVGIAGVTGAGRTELAELIFGRVPKTAGSLHIKGQPCDINSPADSIQNGMCLLTEDRKLTGLFLEQTVCYNTVIAYLSKNKTPLISPKQQNRVATDFINKFKIRTLGADQITQFLSGGNQQKVILAKWFYTDADIFIFDEPTKGIDIGAKEDIYLFMVELLKQGKGIIMVSSDMPELIAMSDTIIVMRKGKTVGQLTNSELTEESILSLSLGGVANESAPGNR